MVMQLTASGRLLRFHAPDLLAVAQDEVHVLVEREQRSHQRPRVLNRYLHPVVDVRQHLA